MFGNILNNIFNNLNLFSNNSLYISIGIAFLFYVSLIFIIKTFLQKYNIYIVNIIILSVIDLGFLIYSNKKNIKKEDISESNNEKNYKVKSKFSDIPLNERKEEFDNINMSIKKKEFPNEKNTDTEEKEKEFITEEDNVLIEE